MASTARHLVVLTSLRHIARHRLRTGLTLLGVVVGVSTFVYAPSLSASIAGSLQSAIDDMAGRADVEVRGPSQGFGERALRLARADADVAIAAPLAQTGGVLAGQSETLAILGIDPRLDRQVRTYNLASGTFLDRARGALLTEAYARERGISIGQRINLIAPGGARRLTVVGTLADGGVASLNSGDIVVVRLDDAQALRGDRNLDSIAIRLKPGRDPGALVERLRHTLPDSLDIDTPKTRRSPLEDIQFVVNFTTSFASLMVLGVGSTLVYNTMAVAVRQRRAEIGVLRALGVSRAGVRALFLLESGVFGLIGSLIGIGVGYALVGASDGVLDLDTLFSGALSAQITPQVPGWLPLVALVAGVGIPMLAGYLPSREAARADPVEALAGARSEVDFMRLNYWRVAAGIALLALSTAAIVLMADASLRRTLDSSVLFALAFGSALSALGGAALLMPGILVGLGRVAPRLMHRAFGLPGLLAAENLARQPRRMSSTAIVLLICGWAAVTTSATNFGYRDFVEEWNASENIWDLTLSGAGPSPFTPALSLPERLPEQVARRPQVLAVVAERRTTIDTGDAEYNIRALDLRGFRAQGARLMWNDGDEEEGYRRLQDVEHPAVLLSSFAAFVHNVRVGDHLQLDTPGGRQSFEVVGTLLGATEPVRPGELSLVIDREVYRRLWHDDRVDRLLIKLEPGSDAQAGRRALQEDYAETGVVVVSPADLSAALSRTITNIVAVSQVLSALLLATLTLGVANTLVISVMDRRREMGLLRALGLVSRQIAISVVLEAALLAVVAGLVAVPLGVYNNYANTLTTEDIFTIRFTLQPGEVIASLALVVLSAVAASYFPARQAGRVDVLEALRWE